MTDEVTAAQAALLSGLSERTIRRRILSGQLPARRLTANRYAIRIEDLPRAGGSASVAARLDTLESRMRALDNEVQALRVMLVRITHYLAPAPDDTAPPPLDLIHALLEHPGQETERLTSPHDISLPASAPDDAASPDTSHDGRALAEDTREDRRGRRRTRVQQAR